MDPQFIQVDANIPEPTNPGPPATEPSKTEFIEVVPGPLHIEEVINYAPDQENDFQGESDQDSVDKSSQNFSEDDEAESEDENSIKRKKKSKKSKIPTSFVLDFNSSKKRIKKKKKPKIVREVSIESSKSSEILSDEPYDALDSEESIQAIKTLKRLKKTRYFRFYFQIVLFLHLIVFVTHAIINGSFFYWKYLKVNLDKHINEMLIMSSCLFVGYLLLLVAFFLIFPIKSNLFPWNSLMYTFMLIPASLFSAIISYKFKFDYYFLFSSFLCVWILWAILWTFAMLEPLSWFYTFFFVTILCFEILLIIILIAMKYINENRTIYIGVTLIISTVIMVALTYKTQVITYYYQTETKQKDYLFGFTKFYSDIIYLFTCSVSKQDPEYESAGATFSSIFDLDGPVYKTKINKQIKNDKFKKIKK